MAPTPMSVSGAIRDRQTLVDRDGSSSWPTFMRQIEIPVDVDAMLAPAIFVAKSRVSQPRSLGAYALLTKPARRKIDLSVRYMGFEIPDVFVVGYGLDYEERYRNLPFVAALAR